MNRLLLIALPALLAACTKPGAGQPATPPATTDAAAPAATDAPKPEAPAAAPAVNPAAANAFSTCTDCPGCVATST